MSWFRKPKFPKVGIADKKLKIPEGLWVKCNNCNEIIYKKEIERNCDICPKCNYHFRINARKRLKLIYDDEQYEEFDSHLRPGDPLGFKDIKKYRDRLREHQARTGLWDALISAQGTIGRHPIVVCAFEFEFMGGSMASVVGEKLARAMERATEQKCPFMSISSSGGARMQEGLISLMQMAKTSAAAAKLGQKGLPFISLLTDPTMGGVSASFAMLGDIIMAEPKALIGFAGPRVIEQTMGQALPEGFQRAEFLLKHGLIDMIIGRKELRKKLIDTLNFFQGDSR